MNGPDSATIGIVSLGEAGNLGDDLILVAAVKAVRRAMPSATIKYLSFGQALVWRGLVDGHDPIPVSAGRDLPGTRKRGRLFAETDAIVFGGGGLLQTSHDPNRPYQWLSYLPRGGRPPVLATGLGIGPVSRRWSNRLRKLGDPFDLLFVRDDVSRQLAANDLGWSAGLCRDFIDAPFITSLLKDRAPAGDATARLGVALRQWEGLSAGATAAKVRDVASREGVEEVRFFVLESKAGRGVDVDFTNAVIALLPDLRTTIDVYEGGDVSAFVRSMVEVSVAISMKLHSSAIWASQDIRMYPIVYAPKIASFFDLPYEGLSVSDVVVSPPVEDFRTPGAGALVGEHLQRLASDRRRSKRPRIGLVEQNFYQVSGAFRYAIARSPFARKRGKR